MRHNAERVNFVPGGRCDGAIVGTDAAMRTAPLSDPQPAAVLRYTERIPYDLEPLERCASARRPGPGWRSARRPDLPLANLRPLTLSPA